MFVTVYHRSDRKGEGGWSHLHLVTNILKSSSVMARTRRLGGSLGPIHYSRYIGVIICVQLERLE